MLWGGVKNLDQAKKILSFGVEKIALSSIIFENINIVSDISKFFGSNSTVVVLDIKRNNDNCFVFTHNGTKKIDIDILTLIDDLQNLGVGEIVINSIDKDGTMTI